MMDGFLPPNRRRLLAGAGGLALSAGSFGARADDATPLRLGVLTDMSSLYADITGPGRLPPPRWRWRTFWHRRTS